MRFAIIVIFLCLLVFCHAKGQKSKYNFQPLVFKPRFPGIKKLSKGNLIRKCFADERDCCKDPPRIKEECDVEDSVTGEKKAEYRYAGTVPYTTNQGDTIFVSTYKDKDRRFAIPCVCA
eukprot:TRINITY_DN1643_c1_g1_i2.p3 TRINITY_DN1643_c1_g1~~TRINITY_DN1643_c1_g1_i2.p3  ORF type:complete len:119 (+),score=9.56 TRINITY_DN1643_c1_g1_i2:268-624(+)